MIGADDKSESASATGDSNIAALLAASDPETAEVIRALGAGKTAEQIAKDLVKLALQDHGR